ncbi:MAG: hypothetical protein ACRDT2_14965, partial [Natronosporangium sp.]
PPAASPPAAAGTAAATSGLDLSPAEQEAVDEARAQFDRFMNAYIDVSTADIPTVDTAEDLFSEVSGEGGGVLPSELRKEIVGGLWSERRVVDGTLEWALVEVVSVDLEREIRDRPAPLVDLRYCVDATAWVKVDAATGESIGSPGPRYAWGVAVAWSDDWGGLGQGPEGWRVVERERREDQPC